VGKATPLSPPLSGGMHVHIHAKKHMPHKTKQAIILMIELAHKEMQRIHSEDLRGR